MSGTSDYTECPCCGEQSETCDDWRPYTRHQSWCGNCGFYEESIRGFMTLEQLNGYREGQNYEDPDNPEYNIFYPPITEDEYKVILKQRKKEKDYPTEYELTPSYFGIGYDLLSSDQKKDLKERNHKQQYEENLLWCKENKPEWYEKNLLWCKENKPEWYEEMKSREVS